MPLVAIAVDYALRAYMLLIFVYVLGSWFPQWRFQNWYRVVGDIVQPYLNIFRALPLRVGMLDLTPAVALLVLMVFERLLIAATLGGIS
jgi:YggT family protein